MNRGRPAALLLVAAGFPLSGLGLVTAYAAANRGGDHVHELFWASVGVALATTAGVLALAGDRRRTAVILTVVLAVLLSLPKFLRAPGYFSFYDEQAHLLAAQALLDGAGLFAANPLNRIVADYPGLHAVTATVASATGGSVFTTGNLLIVLVRVAGCLAVFGLAERLLRAPGAALLAVVVFVANPAFAFFDAQYAYESLASPLVAVVLLLALRLADPTAPAPRPVFVAAATLTVLVGVTHHGSSYVLAVLLAVILLGHGVRRRAGHLVALICVGVLAPIVWLAVVSRYTLTYAGPYVRSNLTAIPDFLGGRSAPRRLFGGFLPVPRYEQVAGFAAVIVLFGLFCWGAFILLRRRREADPAPGSRLDAWVLLTLGAGYFLSLPLVALRGDQVVKRLWEFTFIGVGTICAPALWALVAGHRRTVGRAAAAMLIAVVFVGSGVARSGEHIRFPGPYRPSADPRSMTPDVVAAARWLAAARGTGHRVTGDRTLAAVLGSYGAQIPLTYQEDGVPVWAVFAPEEVTPSVLAEIRRARLEWLAVDLRTAGRFPLTGFYFDESEPGAYVDTRLTERALTKFDEGPFTREYDNGHVVLYRVRQS